MKFDYMFCKEMNEKGDHHIKQNKPDWTHQQ